MKIPQLMVCKGFINRSPAGDQEALFAVLGQEDKQTIHALPHPKALEPEHLKWDLLEHVHFTWLAPYIRTLSKNEIPFFLSALSKSQSIGVMELLGFANHLPTLKKIAKKVFRETLLNQLVQNQTLTPLAFLPDHPLNPLIDLPKKRLQTLIRYLGLHDLSFEMRQIISTKELKKIFSSLNKKEGDFLNTLLLHKEPLIFKRLFLNEWDHSKEELGKRLDERGLHRLGHALFNAADSLLFYLSHRLDMHQGNLLIKFREKPLHDRAETILGKQIQKILTSLNTKEDV